jgi:activating signal cointegrator complex subunit 3
MLSQQVLVATSTLAWGINMPAHLVVVKGTEFFDGKTKRYVDFPITDVIQMMGRAGRPQFDDEAVAVVLVHDVKKHFYKKFMFEPFPVESSLADALPDHFNAEIVAGTIASREDAVDYLTWTYLYRRIAMNPSFYGLTGSGDATVSAFLGALVDQALGVLSDAGCVFLSEDGVSVQPATPGKIASYYYLSHQTMRLLVERAVPTMTLPDALQLVADAFEFDELPVRHNEDLLNADLARRCRIVLSAGFDSPHVKAHLLLQCHMDRQPLPVADYVTDTKSVLDQCIRVLQGMVDFVADRGWLSAVCHFAHLVQMVKQACWLETEGMNAAEVGKFPALMTLPGMTPALASQLVTKFQTATPAACVRLLLSPRRRAVIDLIHKQLNPCVESFFLLFFRNGPHAGRSEATVLIKELDSLPVVSITGTVAGVKGLMFCLFVCFVFCF